MNRRYLLYFFAFLSGTSVLVYEIIWSRMLSLVFGGTVIANSIIIAVFMAGLGLGSIVYGKKVDKTEALLRLFSSLQFYTVITGSVALILLPIMPSLYRSLQQTLISNLTLAIIACLSVALVFIPAFFMGGTLPILSRAAVVEDTEIGTGIGSIYGFNTMGSMVGAFLTGFFLIAWLGQTGSLVLAVIINTIVGLVARFTRKEKNTRTEKQENPPYYDQRVLGFILIITGLSGFCALAYEILWTRALRTLIANSTYSLTSVLIVFLGGISLGSLIYTKFLSRKEHGLFYLALCQIIIAGYALVIALFLNDLPDLLFALRGLLQVSVLRIILPGIFLAFVIAFIPTLCMGVALPLFCRIYTQRLHYMGKSMGKVILINTIGSITGSLCAGFILIPILGVINSTIVIAVINTLIGLTILFLRPVRAKEKTIFASASIIIIVLILSWSAHQNNMILPPSIFRTKMRLDRILFYKETSQGTVVVSEDKLTSIRACYINNSTVCGTTWDALRVVRMLGHLPFFARPEAKNILVIGFGIGITTAAIAEHDIAKIDCIEICPGVKTAAKFFSSYNNDIVHNPKIKFIGADGRNYVLLTAQKYDIISCDPTHPTLGCNTLYTKEHFQNCRQVLKPDGVICQYVPLHKLSSKELKTLINTFIKVFPHTTFWLAHSHGVLLGSDKELSIDFEIFSRTIKEINDPILDDPYKLAASLLLDEHAIQNYTQHAAINTDDHPVLEYFSRSSVNPENWHINLINLLAFQSHPSQVFMNIDDYEMLERYIAGQNLFLMSLIYKNKGEIVLSIEALNKACKTNPFDKDLALILNSEIEQLNKLRKTH